MFLKQGIIIKKLAICLILFLTGVSGNGHSLSTDDYGGYSVFKVNNEPFLILGGELGNSTAADSIYIKQLFPRLKQLHLNTVLAPVYWELIEPQQGKFNFSLVNVLLENARKNDLKLILLWFGSWKNSMSCYAPSWVKTNDSEFPRSKTKEGQSIEILTPFSLNNLEADKKAFIQLMKHLKENDEIEKTVIMVQVENETGMIPDARDYCPAADKAFKQNVPEELIKKLTTSPQLVQPHLLKIWEEQRKKTGGNWEEIFGKSLFTDELFMAWHFAVYTNEIAKAGKQVYSIPMYVNAALNSRGRKPGEYPSAGPLAHLMDIWKMAAPEIDFCAPDIYDKGFKTWCSQYDQLKNPLFIPEIRNEEGNAAKVFYALGKHKAIGFSPFSIEDCEPNNPISKSYEVLNQLIPLITGTGKNDMKGVWFGEGETADTIELNGWKLRIAHDYTLGWNSKAKDGSEWPETGALVIAMQDNTFVLAGTGVVLTVLNGPDIKSQSGILRADRVIVENEKIKIIQRLNGDQTHQGRHIRIPEGNTEIQQFSLYQYQ